MTQAQDSNIETVDAIAETVDRQTLEPNQVVLPSGAILTDKSDLATGSDYFLWQQKLMNLTGGDKKNLGKTIEANKWLAMRLFEVDGKKLTVAEMEQMPFKDIGFIMGRVSGFISASQGGET